jgi:thioredoxin-related protein
MNNIISLIIFVLFSMNLYGDSFMLNSLVEAKTLAKDTNKPILLIFGTDDCLFCVNIKTDIKNGKLTPEVEPYIICYVDIKEHKDLKQEYNVNRIPDSRIIKQDVIIKSKIGYSKNSYKEWLKNAY